MAKAISYLKKDLLKESVIHQGAAIRMPEEEVMLFYFGIT